MSEGYHFGGDRGGEIARRPRVTISVALPESGHARLSVCDVAGQLVRRLVDDDLPMGTHEVSWDGRDAAGRAVATGSYLGRLETGQGVAAVGLSLVRQGHLSSHVRSRRG